jgi:hypothetical protein
MDNPLTEATLSLIAGSLVGGISDRVVTIIDARVRMIESLSLGERTGSLLDSILGIFLHMGLIALGTKFVVDALPWVIEDPASNLLFSMGIAATSPHFEGHLKLINSILFDEGVYQKEQTRQGSILVGEESPSTSEKSQ